MSISLVSYLFGMSRYVGIWSLFVSLGGCIWKVKGREAMKLVPEVVDPIKSVIVVERDVFQITRHPSSYPSSLPTSTPSVNPTLRPSNNPSRAPSVEPSFSPSFVPSFVPSFPPSNDPHYSPSTSPTKSPSSIPSSVPTSQPNCSPSVFPSMAPTSIKYPSAQPSFDPSASSSQSPSSEPSDRRGALLSTKKPMIKDMVHFFNYDPADLEHGPGLSVNQTYVTEVNMVEYEGNRNDLMKNTAHNQSENKTFFYIDYQNSAWSNVKYNLERRYWEEFNMNRTMVNRCQSTPDRKQSPIDLCETHVNSDCKEHHQIRNRGGDYNLNNTEITLQILPSKLRILYSRSNPTLDTTNGKRRPPHADFAHNWNGYIPAIHIDVKIPSEHSLCGRKFSGEYQIYFYHPVRRQPIVQSVFIDIHPAGRPHKHFQKVLNEWQALFDLNSLECETRRRAQQRKYHNFERRMENFLGGFVDDHEFTLWQKSKEEFRDQSSIFDYLLKSDRSKNKILDRARRRVAYPRFEEHYKSPQENAVNHVSYNHGRNLKKNTLLSGKRNATDSCVNASEYFTIGNRSHSCKSLDPQTFDEGCTDNNLTFCPLSCEACYGIGNFDSISLEEESVSSQSSTKDSSRQNHTVVPRWDPFKPRILNSIYLYGYGGSLTEPPCSEWVAWRVLDTPMQISYEQWNQMRNILFNQVDKNCKRTSIDWNGSVARPIQSLNQRSLWKCTERDYLSDVDKMKN